MATILGSTVVPAAVQSRKASGRDGNDFVTPPMHIYDVSIK
jgi:hypothetical protein